MKFIRITLLITFFLSTTALFGDKLAGLRTAKRVVTISNISAPYFTIQVAALREPASDPDFFVHLESIREFVSSDGFTRYTYGQFRNFTEAASHLSRIIDLGYPGAFVLDTRKIQLQGGDPVHRAGDLVPQPGVIYTIQLAAFRFPVYLSHFEGIDNVKEFYLPDRIFRYTVGSFEGDVALSELERIRHSGYPDAFLVPIDRYLMHRIE